MFRWVNAQWRIMFYYVALRSYIGMSHLAINAPIEHSVRFTVVGNPDLPAATTTDFAMLAVNR
jgi:hypothetical protein